MQPLYSAHRCIQILADCLSIFGIEILIFSPGSRNAPLIIHFSSSDKFNCFTIVDERSASFFALGIAQHAKKTVCLCCTSGSALLNYGPALAEAYYRNIPLVVLSADRPINLINIADGQSIVQNNTFQNHVVYETEISNNLSDIECSRRIILTLRKGQEESLPVHINIRLEEPLYTVVTKYNKNLMSRIEDQNTCKISSDTLNTFLEDWKIRRRKMIIIGMNYFNYEMEHSLEELINKEDIVVLTENLSNIKSIGTIQHIDRLFYDLSQKDWQKIKPDLVITIGTNLVSKKLKLYLRDVQFKHYHVNRLNFAPNTFGQNVKLILSTEATFLAWIIKSIEKKGSKVFQKLWTKFNNKVNVLHDSYIESVPYSDLKIFSIISSYIPSEQIVHLGNSSIVRYAQLFPWNKGINFYSNRGTSGIEGCLSTAIGTAVHSNIQNTIIIGDLSFFYDSNALLINNIPKNFRIILINNNGGGIFHFIEGPDTVPNFENSIVAKHNNSARHICLAFGLEYKLIINDNNIYDTFSTFWEKSNAPKLLEIKTNGELSGKLLRKYFKAIRSV